MKVLQVHNRYRSGEPSGENTVVDDEARLLQEAGVTVLRHLRSSDEIDHMSLFDKAALPLRPFYSREDATAVAAIIDRHVPDLLHLHNPNPLISMAVVDVAAKRGLPVVMTVHNHRRICIKGTFYREGRPCHDCLAAASPWPGVVHACYRDSRAQSLVAAGALVAHRRSYSRIDRFIAISQAMRTSMLASGVDPNRVVVKPNTVRDPGDATATEADPGGAERRFLFVGRLSEEKGVRLLLDAWDHHQDGTLGVLTLVGSGPLEDYARARVRARTDVLVAGRLDSERVGIAMRESTVVLVPSTWQEPFGLVVLEAYARARPVLSTGEGGLADLLHADCSWRAAPTVDAWAAALARVDPTEARARGRRARARFEAVYSPAVVTSQLISIYEGVLAQRSTGGSAAQ